jgi:VanZ family protein
VNFILRILAILCLFAILLLSLVPGDYRPHTQILPGGLEHVAAYTLAAFLLGLAYHGRLSPGRIVLLLTAYGALLELGQLWVPGRHGQAIDVVADFVGAMMGVVMVYYLAPFLPHAFPEN